MPHGPAGQDPVEASVQPRKAQGGPGGRDGMKTMASLYTHVFLCKCTRTHGSGGKWPRGPLQLRHQHLEGREGGRAKDPIPPAPHFPQDTATLASSDPHSGEEVCRKGSRRLDPTWGLSIMPLEASVPGTLVAAGSAEGTALGLDRCPVPTGCCLWKGRSTQSRRAPSSVM